MSHFVCPNCAHESDIFGKGGGETARDRNVGAVSRADSAVRAGAQRRRRRRADRDRRARVAAPAQALLAAAERVAQQVSIAVVRRGARFRSRRFADGLRRCEIPFTKHTLANGLDVIVHEDHHAPLVAVSVWYHVGSKNERPGLTGFAHLFEHLMFEGSAHQPRGYFEPLQEAGAALNGSTSADRTNYWEVVPSRRGASSRSGWKPIGWAGCCRR